MNDLRSLLDTLDDAIRAYKQRIADLEQIVVQQQAQIEQLKQQPSTEQDRIAP